ncbi:hypothetical protein ACFPZ0_09615 [Streptomonospora nanhaiensis]|uniref:DUF8083 domain-containing protein n=1 Tax=Streptomonospora nanhaiensis TaxID=1323731 RepID=A0A853BPH0_9ACTN|nr:hypothetical protein [Streptomonospora nanhaiensis]NYI96615.1 hypothetical protein [Streptomonospora nanhaiensis]
MPRYPCLPYTAYLRIYQPVSSFSPQERAYWRAYAVSARRPRRSGAVAAEHAESLRRLVASPPVPAPECESGDAYVRRVNGETYICPWQTRLRSWLALREFRTETPARISAAFLPEAVAADTEERFRAWRERGEPLRTLIQTSTWTVPLAWFAPFDAAERCLVLGGAGADGDGGHPGRACHPAGGAGPAPRTLLYVARVADARRRLERAIRVLREHVGEGPALAAAERLEDWLLGVAHPRGLLELDYAGLVHLLDDDSLREDESVAEVAAAITGLQTGEHELAAAMYHRVSRRWKVVQALRNAN